MSKFSPITALSSLMNSFWTTILTILRILGSFRGSVLVNARRAVRVYRREGARGVIQRVRLLGGEYPRANYRPDSAALYGDIPKGSIDFKPLVSIIVPNFNHARYLTQRLDSIYQQTYTNYEVILLDDASTDDSRSILLAYARRYSERTQCLFNETNSGGVFLQWRKGLSVAKGELVWIAESDDYCHPDFLEELVRCFRKEGVALAFGYSRFVEGSPAKCIRLQEQYWQDLPELDPHSSFIRSANALVSSSWIVKNIVPNVSGVLFRHPGAHPVLQDPRWLGLRLCGDWIFYASVIRGKLVAYNPKAVNFYRQHIANTSASAQNEYVYYREHEQVARCLVSLYPTATSNLEKQATSLYGHWRVRHGEGKRSEFDALYSTKRAIEEARMCRGGPNILMVVYALAAGGGETFPIVLANELVERGLGVTLLNCRQAPTEEGIRRLVSSRVGVLELDDLSLISDVCNDMDIQIVHTHHAWCDMTVAMWLRGNQRVKHVITTHGMYDVMGNRQAELLITSYKDRLGAIVYTAEKNRLSIPPNILRNTLVERIDNSLPPKNIRPVDRESLNIEDDDFVLCLVSRAIPEKGWREAIDAVSRANERSPRPIVLLLIGEGPEFTRLRSVTLPLNVRFLGFKPNIRDYFAMSDMGFLPSKFLGESAPLVVIDCLLAGRPMLASDVGEIRYMLQTTQGVAGKLIELSEGNIDTKVLASMIVDLANNREAYISLLARVPSAASKFQIDPMVEKYRELYQAVVNASQSGLTASRN